jgi:hypothetical protein
MRLLRSILAWSDKTLAPDHPDLPPLTKRAEGEKMKQLTRICVVGVCILGTVAGSTKLAAQDGCPPARCFNGTHSVCHKECDPNVSPICSPKCVCTCVPDNNAMIIGVVDETLTGRQSLDQDACKHSTPALGELLSTELWIGQMVSFG